VREWRSDTENEGNGKRKEGERERERERIDIQTAPHSMVKWKATQFFKI